MAPADVYARLAQRLGKGPPALLSGWSAISSPLLARTMATEDLDCVVIDMQHGAYDVPTAIAAISEVTLAGKPAIVRVPVGDFSTASRLLDFGAHGIIAPMINSPEDAKRFVSFVKYPPVGERSWGADVAVGASGLGGPKEYLLRANALTKALAMIETREALGCVDAILAVEGLDGVFVGPNDLSIALTNGATVDVTHPEVDKALTLILERAHAAGKVAGVFANTGELAGDLVRRGFDLVSLSCDFAQLRLGVQTMLRQAGRPPPAGDQPTRPPAAGY